MDSSKANKSIINSIKEQPVSIKLPERLRDSYHFYDFLKQSSDKEIYQLLDNKDNSYILKRGTGRQFALIKQEYQIFKQLESIPRLAIPKCAEYWEDGEYCYLLRHYIEGCSLSEYFEKRMYFSNLEIVNYMLEICYIIQTLHSQNPPIIHRDIKPENFILERGTGRLYLIDLDNLALHCEALITALYEEDALTRIPGIDYAGRETITKEERAETDTRWLRNCMAYRDQILYQRLGSYSKYKNYIFSALDSMLNPASYSPSDDSRAALYQYATSSGSEADQKYTGAFVDIVASIRYAMDWVDSYPSPIEE